MLKSGHIVLNLDHIDELSPHPHLLFAHSFSSYILHHKILILSLLLSLDFFSRTTYSLLILSTTTLALPETSSPTFNVFFKTSYPIHRNCSIFYPEETNLGFPLGSIFLDFGNAFPAR